MHTDEARQRGPFRWSSCVALSLAFVGGAPLLSQVDDELAESYFLEAQQLCERDGGKLWGVSLCGPMAFADAATGTLATNQEIPDGPRPRALGYANTALGWGDEVWSTYVWSMVPRDDEGHRGRLLMHELFHRVQRDLDLMTPNGDNSHLDTLEGRYWLQLEWRALARALGTTGEQKTQAIADALRFRVQRRSLFPDFATSEQYDEIREGLAQYTGTVLSTPDQRAASADALQQLYDTEKQPSFVRTFAYTSGAAYGVLLDHLAPEGWARRVTPQTDLAALLAEAAGISLPASDALDGTNVRKTAQRYGGTNLRIVEERLLREREARVAELRAKLVDGQVVVFPKAKEASFVTTGSTAIPDEGTTLSNYRAHGEWGELEADLVLIASDAMSFRVEGPVTSDGAELSGPSWRASLASGWQVVEGPAGRALVSRSPE